MGEASGGEGKPAAVDLGELRASDSLPPDASRARVVSEGGALPYLAAAGKMVGVSSSGVVAPTSSTGRADRSVDTCSVARSAVDTAGDLRFHCCYKIVSSADMPESPAPAQSRPTSARQSKQLTWTRSQVPMHRTWNAWPHWGASGGARRQEIPRNTRRSRRRRTSLHHLGTA